MRQTLEKKAGNLIIPSCEGLLLHSGASGRGVLTYPLVGGPKVSLSKPSSCRQSLLQQSQERNALRAAIELMTRRFKSFEGAWVSSETELVLICSIFQKVNLLVG